MQVKLLSAAFLLCAAFPWCYLRADETEKREQLVGKWEAEDADAKSVSWTLAGDLTKLHITEFDGDKELIGFECSPDGKPCGSKTSGKRGEVSMWFNGSKLVVMQTRGTDAFQQEFKLASDDILEVKIVPLVPSGSPQKHRFHRVKAAQSK